MALQEYIKNPNTGLLEPVKGGTAGGGTVTHGMLYPLQEIDLQLSIVTPRQDATWNMRYPMLRVFSRLTPAQVAYLTVNASKIQLWLYHQRHYTTTDRQLPGSWRAKASKWVHPYNSAKYEMHDDMDATRGIASEELFSLDVYHYGGDPGFSTRLWDGGQACNRGYGIGNGNISRSSIIPLGHSYTGGFVPTEYQVMTDDTSVSNFRKLNDGTTALWINVPLINFIHNMAYKIANTIRMVGQAKNRMFGGNRTGNVPRFQRQFFKFGLVELKTVDQHQIKVDGRMTNQTLTANLRKNDAPSRWAGEREIVFGIR